jgi:hypothetical protein
MPGYLSSKPKKRKFLITILTINASHLDAAGIAGPSPLSYGKYSYIRK